MLLLGLIGYKNVGQFDYPKLLRKCKEVGHGAMIPSIVYASDSAKLALNNNV